MSVLDFETEDCKLTESEANTILSVYIKYHGSAFYREGVRRIRKSLNENKDMQWKIAQDSVACSSAVGRTEALEIMCLKFQSLYEKKQFFRKPKEHLVKEFKRMKNSSKTTDKLEFCSLMYVSLKGGCILNTTPDFNLFSNIIRLFKIKIDERNENTIRSPLLVKRDEQIMLQHSFVLVALLSFIFEDNSAFRDFFIKNCDINILLRYVRFRESTSFITEEVDVIVCEYDVSNAHYDGIVERLATEYISTQNEDIIKHRNMEYKRFKEIFEGFTSKAQT